MQVDFIEKSCKVKKHYATKKQGLTARNILLAEHLHTVPMDVYKCRFCHAWHVGHAPWLVGRAAARGTFHA